MKNGPYTLVTAPEGYPGKRYRGRYAYEHHVVWWQNTGVVPDSASVVHHKNEDKRDNRFSNLEMISRGAHTAHHSVPAALVELPCGKCGKTFERIASNYRCQIKNGQAIFYCTRSCQVSAQQIAKWERIRGRQDRLRLIKGRR
jgi:hypothetical protein